jgi:opacity protein-like surface antigen
MHGYLRCVAALALAAACNGAFAQDEGTFFVSADTGQATYHVDNGGDGNFAQGDTASAAALRLGYRWHGQVDFGLEGGYVDLGEMNASLISGAVVQEATVHPKGWLLGATGKYYFADQWFVSARGGWLHTSSDVEYRVFTPVGSASDSSSAGGNGWYAGVGVGYDVAPGFSLGLAYDNYDVQAKTGEVSADANVGTWMLTAEYRF